MCQFVTLCQFVTTRDYFGKSTVFTHKIGFDGDIKEGEAPMYQFFEKEQKQAGQHVAHR